MGIRHSKQGSILFVGLDGAGKTTILQTVRNEAFPDRKPTVGFTWSMNGYRWKEFTFHIFDVGGGESQRDLWKKTQCVAQGFLSGVMFVVDSSNVERLAEARDFFRDVHKALGGPLVPVLVLANKQDLPGALTPYEIGRDFSLSLSNSAMPFHVCGTSVIDSRNLHEAMHKMCNLIKERARIFKNM